MCDCSGRWNRIVLPTVFVYDGLIYGNAISPFEAIL